MNTRRCFISIVAAIATAAGVFSWAQDSKPKEVMGSSVFDWTQLVVKKSAKGESRRILQAPTATLDELEIHVTTLNPGEMAPAASASG